MSINLRKALDRTRPLIDVTFENAPAERLDAANDPLAAAHTVLDAGRVLLAADSLGAAQTMLDRAVAFAKERVQFGKPLSELQGIQWKLADMAIELEACRALLYRAANRVDMGKSTAIDATKYFIAPPHPRDGRTALFSGRRIGCSQHLG